jgi:steroid 5-alpha reductase family enzyme
MAAAWSVQQKTERSSWVDVTWSLAVGAVGAALALWPFGGSGPLWRQLLVAALAAGWSMRLGLHIAARNHNSGDDARYRTLIDKWRNEAPRRMFFFLQSQAAVGVVLVLTIALAAHAPGAELRVQDVFGVAVLIVGILGEAVSDRQLREFAKHPANRNAVCDVGLWHYSRHPNYFFEWLVWLAYPAIAIGFHNPPSWLSLAAPICMYWVLVHVSGLPPLEEHMLRTRPDDFRRYQARTSAFFPLPPRCISRAAKTSGSGEARDDDIGRRGRDRCECSAPRNIHER